MKLSEIIHKDEYTSDFDAGSIDVLDITTSPSEITDNTVFVFINSINFDITQIIDYVISKKPCAVICEAQLPIPNCDVPIFKVECSRRSLALMYSRFHNIDYKKLKLIGVTGTNGKTSTATMILHILEYAGKQCGFIGTGKIISNGKSISDELYSMTTPDPALLYRSIKKMQDEGCVYIIMEVSSHALYFEKVFPITFDIGIFTNLSEEHIDFHGNMNDYYSSKSKLFGQCKFGIFNFDDDHSKRAYYECGSPKTAIGIIQDADVNAREIKQNGLTGSEYIYRDKRRLFKVKLALPGVYNIYNSMMALTAAIALGIKPYLAKEGIRTLKKIDGRFEVIESSITAIIDYAHTDEALKNLLKTVQLQKRPEQNVICVFGCGGDRYKSKRPAMAKTAERYADHIIVTTDNSRSEDASEIINDILTGFSDKTKRTVITSRESAIERAILSAENGDIIVITGKGHERYNIDKSGYHKFDERAIINKAIEKRNGIENNENNHR